MGIPKYIDRYKYSYYKLERQDIMFYYYWWYTFFPILIFFCTFRCIMYYRFRAAHGYNQSFCPCCDDSSQNQQEIRVYTTDHYRNSQIPSNYSNQRFPEPEPLPSYNEVVKNPYYTNYATDFKETSTDNGGLIDLNSRQQIPNAGTNL